MEFIMTKRHVARGARPDIEANNNLYLIKNVSSLRPTYQIRLLLYRATQEGVKLVIEVPKSCKISTSLKALIKSNLRNISIRAI